MKIEFNVPEGDFCQDCPHQESFDVEEIECITLEGKYPRYIRTIVANCHLFNEPIQGKSLDKITKCLTCKNKTAQ